MTGARILVVGEAITAFMTYPGESELAFHGPFPSGAPVIFASASARLGAEVDLVAGVGDDAFGAQFRARLARDGLALRNLVVDPVRPTASVFIWYEGGGRRKFGFHVEGSAALSAGPETLDVDPPPDWLHVSGATLWFGGATGETCWRAVERAIRDGVRISFDPNVRANDLSERTRRQFEVLLDAAEVVLASAGELEALGGDEVAITGRGAIVCHKNGPNGATVVTSDGRWRVPAPAVTEVDPDGAGDIFAAGFVVARLAGLDPVASARVAVQVASDSVGVRGPLESTIDSLDQYLARPSATGLSASAQRMA